MRPTATKCCPASPCRNRSRNAAPFGRMELQVPMPKLLPILISLALPCAAQLRQDIEYSKPGGISLTLDAFTPPGPGPFPAVIIVHGGGWVNGTKTSYVPP